jgi:acetyl-CoA carboxylase alpha subunit|tara:strand:- start:105 stop:275 length:171 start_codon:yes stop_codon:yes gene_type:complete
MVDLLVDMKVIENAIIAFSEGASDEKQAALNSLENLLKQKMNVLAEFEKQEENHEI